MTRALRKPTVLPVLLYLFLTALPAQGQVHYHDNGAPWKHTAEKGPDAEAGGWYYNLGITGLRAVLMKDRPMHLRVKYVFEGTPAHGKVKVDDIASIAKTQADDGSWGVPQQNTFAPLALLASGNKAYLPVVKKNVKMHARTTKARDNSWLINWRYMAAAIVMRNRRWSTRG